MKDLILRFDANLTLTIQNIPSIHGFMSTITRLGDPLLIIAVGLSAIAYGLLIKSRATITAFGYAMSAYALGGLLKEFTRRARPDNQYVDEMRFRTFSFPSAHALGSLLLFGILAYLAFRHLSSPWNIFAPTLLAALVFFIGMSRVYLGAHYPSDVIGGWLIGGIVLVLIVKYVL